MKYNIGTGQQSVKIISFHDKSIQSTSQLLREQNP